MRFRTAPTDLAVGEFLLGWILFLFFNGGLSLDFPFHFRVAKNKTLDTLYTVHCSCYLSSSSSHPVFVFSFHRATRARVRVTLTPLRARPCAPPVAVLCRLRACARVNPNPSSPRPCVPPSGRPLPPRVNPASVSAGPAFVTKTKRLQLTVLRGRAARQFAALCAPQRFSKDGSVRAPAFLCRDGRPLATDATKCQPRFCTAVQKNAQSAPRCRRHRQCAAGAAQASHHTGEMSRVTDSVSSQVSPSCPTARAELTSLPWYPHM